MQEPGTDGGVVETIDEDEATHFVVLGVGIESDGPVQVDVADADVVEVEGGRSGVLHGVHVHLVLGMSERGADRAGADLEQVGAPREHRVLVHPDDVSFEMIGHLGRIGVGGQDVAPADVDLVGEGERDRLAGHRLVGIVAVDDDVGDRGRRPEGRTRTGSPGWTVPRTTRPRSP